MKAPDHNAEYWDTRYKEGNTGWDMHQVSPPLRQYIDTVADKGTRILIPGCGNAYEAAYLLENGFTNVTLIDISPTLVDQLKERFRGKDITIICGDFFELEGEFDLILEQTFFCAFPPEMREQYVQKCFELLASEGKIAGVFFNKPVGPQSPPYTATDEDYRLLFSPYFTLNIFEECQTSIAPRLGKEVNFEFIKRAEADL